MDDVVAIKFSETIVNTNFTLMLYILFVAAVLIILNKFGESPIGLLREVLFEIISIFKGNHLGPSALNGVCVIVIFLLIVLYFILGESPNFMEILGYLGGATSKAANDAIKPLLIFMLAVMSIVSVALTKKD